ncbi:hypothetical protein FRB96_003894 [Tulasnella sp. 330]|nr:hypothetical protein FRB96_003894 [Tulasnella sp. 330]
MDPQNPASFNLRKVKLPTGRTYEYCDQIPASYEHGETPILFLIHGFPELWYDWRHQIGPWVRRGWRVIAPSMLGYSGSDKPEDPALYTALSLAGDLADLLDALDVRKPVVVVAHDWGSTSAFAFATRYTERTKALVSISVPRQPPMPMSLTTDQMVARVGPDRLGYWFFFCSETGPTEIQSNIPRFIDMLYQSHRTVHPKLFAEGTMEKIMKGVIEAPGPSDLMSTKERQFHIDTLEAGGINKPLNYYRQTPHAFAIQEALKLNPILPNTLPVLLLAADHEPFGSPDLVERSRAFVPSLEVVRMDSAHFIMLEKREEVTQIIGDWVEKKLKGDE